MYAVFLFIHSVFRWLVVTSLLYGIASSVHGMRTRRGYSRTDHLTRTVTNSISHTQLLIGFTLYFVLSPVTQYFVKNGADGVYDLWFFGLYHIAMMLVAIVVLTIGGSIAKRAENDAKKFKITAIYFSISLFLILAAIPWHRPLLRWLSN
jgi:hypothetical protein